MKCRCSVQEQTPTNGLAENTSEDDDQVVEAMQSYEVYDSNGVLTSKRLLEIHFRLSRRSEFEELAMKAGFQIKAFYGDYSYSEFNAESSPFMVWILERAG